MVWHHPIVNQMYVKYFTELKKEQDMLNRVLHGIPENVRKNFYDNVTGFRAAWDKELEIKTSLRKNEIRLVSTVEKSGQDVESKLRVHNKEISNLANYDEHVLCKALYHDQTILISLRINESNGNAGRICKGWSIRKIQAQIRYS